MPVGQEGRRGHAGPHTARSRGHPSLEWPVPLSGTGRFSDFEAEFNYMLSLTSSGDDGTIARVICQRDTCTCNKPKAKRSVSVNAKHTGLGPDPEPLHLRWDTEEKSQGWCPHPPRCPRPPRPRGICPRQALPKLQVSPQAQRGVTEEAEVETPARKQRPHSCSQTCAGQTLRPQRPGALAPPWVRGKATHLKMALSLIVNKDREGKKKTKERK